MVFSLFDDVIEALCGADLAEFRAEYSLRGYSLVGSMPLFHAWKDTNESDVDVVLLADGSDEATPSTPLPQLAHMLSQVERLRSCSVWYVHALVPIVKIQLDKHSVNRDGNFSIPFTLPHFDILWVDGCWINHHTNNFRFRRFQVDDPDHPERDFRFLFNPFAVAYTSQRILPSGGP